LWVERLELVDFRSYRSAELDLTRGVTVLVGPNGRGKTNVVEALHRVAVGASHRIAGDAALVREGATDAVIRTALRTDDDHRRTVDVQLGSGRTRAQVDGQAVRRSGGRARCAARRRVRTRGSRARARRPGGPAPLPRPAAVAASDELRARALRLRAGAASAQHAAEGPACVARSGGDGADGARDGTLAAWTEQLVAHGAPLVAARLAAVAALRDPVAEAHARLTGSDTSRSRSRTARMRRSTRPGRRGDRDAMRAALDDRRGDEERRRGVTLVGPHRDELVITLDGLPARTTASQGEAWSVALACKVGSRRCSPVSVTVRCCCSTTSSASSTRHAGHGSRSCVREFDQVIVTAAVDADVPLGATHRSPSR
jgi:DNA replication and repair protein RecF